MNCQRIQRRPISVAQTAKIKTRKLAQPLSIVPLGARKIERSSSRIRANPPNHNVVRPNLLLGRRTLCSRAVISVASGSLNAIGSWNYCCSVAFAASIKLLRLCAGKRSNVCEAVLLTTTFSDLGIEIEKRLHARSQLPLDLLFRALDNMQRHVGLAPILQLYRTLAYFGDFF